MSAAPRRLGHMATTNKHGHALFVNKLAHFSKFKNGT